MVVVATLAAALGAPLVGAGNAAASATPQVVGGTTTAITQAPYIVSLYTEGVGIDPYEGQFCGGVIVDATHVITAAHCLFNAEDPAQPDYEQATAPDTVAVLAGTNDLPTTAGTPSVGIEDQVTQTSFDPSWNQLTGQDDIGILTLATPLWTGSTPPLDGVSTIAPIPLISAAGAASAERPGAPATVTGWGYTEPITSTAAPEPGGYPNLLQSTALSFVLLATCAQDLAGEGGIAPAQICAGAPSANPEASSCYGDSGGPLVVSPGGQAPQDDVLAGLVDFGDGCGFGAPDVFTDVSAAEITSFLGSDPPQAPYQTSGQATISGAGSTATCDPGSWAGAAATFSYQFYADLGTTTAPQALTGVQASSEYTVPSGGVPGPIFCLVTATNAGGFSTAGSTDEITPPAQTITTNVTSTSTTITSGAVTTFVTVRTSETTATATVATATTPVTLAETPSVRPTLDVVSRRCAKQRCTVVVSTQDVGGPGVRTVSATLTHLTRVACPASTRRTTCPRSVRVHDSVTALTGGRFQITGADLAPGSYELTLVAIDRSGRRQSRTTIVSLAVPR